MKQIIVHILILISFGFTLNKPQGRPTSKSIGARGEKTYILFNSNNGASIKFESGSFDESIVFKRILSKKDVVTNWSLETTSPTLIAEDRELAYKYYSDIPGVVWIEKLLFCDETEISNLDWIEFLQLTGHEMNHPAGNEIMEKIFYNNSPQFYYFPVVNINYEDAIEYCKWRTSVVTDNYNNKIGNSKNSPNYTRFVFRLPTKDEWIKCASFATDTVKFPHLFTTQYITTTIDKSSLSYLNFLGATISSKDLLNFNNEIEKDLVLNCKRDEKKYLNLETPYYIWDYPANNFGIYNIMGNVSEMISEKGVSMGGSFRDLYSECKVNNQFLYSKPSDNLGFRCVCDLEWPNKK